MRASKPTTRILPALLLALMAVLPAYIGSLWTGLSRLAWAEESELQEAPAADSAATLPDTAADAGVEPDASTRPEAATAAADPETAEPFDPLTLTKAEIDVLRQLARRRDELAARERALDDREAMLRATEERIAEQVRRMQQMKAEYEQMVTQRDEAAEANLRRLVAVYEAMKPDEAARIFETMEGAVLLDVVTRMGERRLAPILAQMSPAKAQALTIAMANRRAFMPAASGG
jgi:flagellar motility protein MotE (MotC chaperone)